MLRIRNGHPLDFSADGLLIHFRLMQSIRLLCGSDASISQIAQQVGFGSSSYYTECFKKEMHCTPLKYRQNNQRKQRMRCVI